MINFEEALKIAKDYCSKGEDLVISDIYDSDDMWIFFMTKNGKISYGNSAFSINKSTSVINRFALPSEKNFEILKKAKKIVL